MKNPQGGNGYKVGLNSESLEELHLNCFGRIGRYPQEQAVLQITWVCPMQGFKDDNYLWIAPGNKLGASAAHITEV